MGRRTADLFVACLGLIALGPVLLLAGLAVVLDSPGGVLYGAWRCGVGGRRFRMFKFRTMRQGADHFGAITSCDDPRVTRVGQFLRSTRLDELPQFLNLLAGHMTLVGPRPEDPRIVELYTPAQRTVLSVKPGITGWCQLHFAGESALLADPGSAEQDYIRLVLPEKLRCDLEYLGRRTAWSDMQIIFLTALTVLGRRPGPPAISGPKGATGGSSWAH